MQSERRSLEETLNGRLAVLDRLRGEREAAQTGVFMADSFNNTPYSQQRRDEVRMALAALGTQIAGIETRIATLTAEREAETERLERLGSAELRAPAEGYVWELFATGGAYVREAQPVLSMIDCRSVFLDVAIGRSRIDSLHVGQPATIRLAGDRTPLAGRVTAIRSADPSPETLALPSSRLNRAPGTLQVMVAFDTPAGVPAEGGGDHRFCQVGRQATVDFGGAG